MEPVAILARGEDIVRRHAARGADGEIVHVHELADEGADRLGLRRERWTLSETLPFGDALIKPLRGGETLNWKAI